MTFHILCGIPGSGKSTLGQNLSGYVVSTDRIRKFLWQDEAIVSEDMLVFALADKMIDYLLGKGRDVIFDATNLTVDRRKKYIELAAGQKTRIVLHWVNCPFKTALQRNRKRDRKVPEAVIGALYKSFQRPRLGEGMDVIKEYDLDLALTRLIGPGPQRGEQIILCRDVTKLKLMKYLHYRPIQI